MKLCRIENLNFAFNFVLQDIDIATWNNGLPHKATWVSVRPGSSIDILDENTSPRNGVIRPHFQSFSVSARHVPKCRIFTSI
jgi:hypothetical protein